MKKAASYNYSCDHPGCTAGCFMFGTSDSIVLDKQMADSGWLIVYPEEPFSEVDCNCYCPKHKHRSVIPSEKHNIIGLPFDVILAEDRMLEDGTIIVKTLPHIGPPPEFTILPAHVGSPPEMRLL